MASGIEMTILQLKFELKKIQKKICHIFASMMTENGTFFGQKNHIWWLKFELLLKIKKKNQII
jgi:hypothetical protein